MCTGIAVAGPVAAAPGASVSPTKAASGVIARSSGIASGDVIAIAAKQMKSPSLSQASSDAKHAASALKKATQAARAAKKNVKAAGQAVTSGETELSEVRDVVADMTQSLDEIGSERAAAEAIEELIEAGGTQVIDPATAAACNIHVGEFMLSPEANPYQPILEIEREIEGVERRSRRVIANLTDAREREDSAEEHFAAAAREQAAAQSALATARKDRKRAARTKKSADKVLKAAKEMAEQARIARERAEEAARAARSMERPASSEITSPFGMRTHPITGVYKLHSGTDFSVGDGLAHAARAGTVEAVTYDGAYGNMVTISHGEIDGDMVQTRYAHLSSATVSAGQSVEAGSVVGHIGSTGYSTGAHLHFEVLVDGGFVDPMTWLNR